MKVKEGKVSSFQPRQAPKTSKKRLKEGNVEKEKDKDFKDRTNLFDEK